MQHPANSAKFELVRSVMIDPNHRRVRLADDLVLAAERGEIHAVFQAQYSIETGSVVAVEALSRWEHPQFGMVSPSEFIPLAEESGLIGTIGDHMLRLGCAAAVEWHRIGHAIEVAVNVSVLQLESVTLESRVPQLLSDLSLDPRLLTLEITESTAVADVPPAVDRLHSLRQTGVTISVDDFGSAHSSIDQVLAIPATELKLDQTLVRDISPGADERIAAAIAFGKERGLRLVAEGVETARQLERVVRLECDRVQGFFLSRPVANPELGSLFSFR